MYLEGVGEYSVTSHADIVPTVLAALEADLPLENLFTGNNLLSTEAIPGNAIVSTQKTMPVPMEWAYVDGKEQEKFHFDNFAETVNITRRVSMDDDPLNEADEERLKEVEELLLRRKRHYKPGQPEVNRTTD